MAATVHTTLFTHYFMISQDMCCVTNKMVLKYYDKGGITKCNGANIVQTFHSLLAVNANWVIEDEHKIYYRRSSAVVKCVTLVTNSALWPKAPIDQQPSYVHTYYIQCISFDSSFVKKYKIDDDIMRKICTTNTIQTNCRMHKRWTRVIKPMIIKTIYWNLYVYNLVLGYSTTRTQSCFDLCHTQR